MPEVIEQRTQISAKQILENLRDLRHFDGDEVVFWERLLYCASLLCKAPVVISIALQQDSWNIQQEYYKTEDLKDQRQIIVSSAIELIGRTEQNGFAHERLNASFPQISLPVALVIKMAHLDVQDNAFMVVVTDKSNNQQFNDIIVRTQLISDIPLSYYRYKQIAGTEIEDPSKQRLIHVLEVAHAAFEKDKFILCCMTLVNELAHRFHCSQVSLGWEKGHYVRTVAISHLEDFKKQGSAVTALNDVYEEAYEQNDIIAYPKMDEHFVITKVHEAYSRRFGLQQIVSVPVRMHGDIVGIITLEKQEAELSRTDVDAVQLIADQVATWLASLHYQDRWIGGRIALKAKRTLDSLLGVEHSLIKAVVLLLSVVLLFVLFGTWDYRVEGSVTLATDSVSYVSSPYDGRIQDVMFREGDEVKKGALLVKLDTQELLLRESVEAADVIRYTREAEKNLANEALADMKIAQSRVQEAKAGLDRVRFHLGQANITAPFDGIIIEGDNRKLLSSPVSRGDLLLKIARVEGMYAKIKVHESDVDGIQEGAKGSLIFLSRPDDVFSITLDKIIPMAEVDSREGNVFVIKAKIDDPQQSWWRPGMSGIAKIEMGKRRIFWILTHRAVDFIRMYLWW